MKEKALAHLNGKTVTKTEEEILKTEIVQTKRRKTEPVGSTQNQPELKILDYPDVV